MTVAPRGSQAPKTFAIPVPYPHSAMAETSKAPRTTGAAAPASDSVTHGAFDALVGRLFETRRATEALVEPLSDEDLNLQSMPEASPAKWHLAHTTWFFETFILAEHQPDHKPFHPAFAELFNSYYNGVGRQHPRPQRALLSRPDRSTVVAWREHVNQALEDLLADADDDLRESLAPLIALGVAHEQQHQELILTDLKHAFNFNPLAPALGLARDAQSADATPLRWRTYDGGIVEIGAEPSAEAGDDPSRFCFDNETPRHRELIDRPYALATRPVNCAEFLEFMADGGYRDPLLWLSDGWAWVQEHEIEAPMYWRREDGGWSLLTLAGRVPVHPAEPVCHLNFYEAAAFAAWADARLPTEAEWEQAAAAQPIVGQFAGSRRYHPAPLGADDGPLRALFGSVWEWTASSYAPYPGFQPAAGAVGEYNGKFMANQMVLRGGSCATPDGHVRASYRNFFYPPDRWQFSGVRLARDA